MAEATNASRKKSMSEIPRGLEVPKERQCSLKCILLVIRLLEKWNNLKLIQILENDYYIGIIYIPAGLRGYGYMFNKKFTCPECDSTIKINLSDYIIDESSDEREMGGETEYSIEAEGVCPVCDYEYTVSGSIYEYPVGVENYNDLKIE